ncbi:aromatic amino acid ammonia-lyase [Natronincola ferrireducens]|uniref:Histidine ammonia-lyase n=1 Tax=Natronincola ferrireducens TaxID=393762 RepID=A0A1G8Z3I4_9FIRM|nr:aromatic amino acid ammonia-lyase [Natronincola ferrireducens]SDK09611.1 histidine ammonia-lyase [Natronincola ferrireducens]
MGKILCLNGENLELEALLAYIEENPFKVKISRTNLEGFHGELLNPRKVISNTKLLEETPDIMLRTYALCYGNILPEEIGRISLVLLLNAGLRYGNDLRQEFIERILYFINHNISPCIHDMNKHEISAMSELSLILAGEEKTLCYFNGEYTTTGDVFKELQLEKMYLTRDEIVFMVNACCISTAISVYTLKEAKKLVKTADICLSMNLEAIRGEVGAFDYRLHEIGRPYRNQIMCAENIKRLIEDSEFTTEKARRAFDGDKGARCQDAICYRASPQTHGGVRDTIQWLEENLVKELNNISYTINPIIGYSLDLMIISLVDLGNISERRSFRLNDSNLSYGLPMNLVGENPGFNHGFPVIQAAATAVLAELKLLALPNTACTSIFSNRNKYFCTTYPSALKSLEVISLLTKVLAIEMFMSAQAMDLAKDKLIDYSFGKGTVVALSEFRKYVKIVRENRFAAPDMVESDRLVKEGVILSAVEKSIGHLK